MPQIRIEYSGNIDSSFDARDFARQVHELVAATVDTELVIARPASSSCQTFLIGDGSDDQAMIHVDVRILSGRTQPQKEQLGQAVLAALEQAIHKSHLRLQLTVEVRELDRDNYHKRLI
jgi:5-carboxymethyl-2-hydroxymuconate isomerase